MKIDNSLSIRVSIRLLVHMAGWTDITCTDRGEVAVEGLSDDDHQDVVIIVVDVDEMDIIGDEAVV